MKRFFRRHERIGLDIDDYFDNEDLMYKNIPMPINTNTCK